MHLVVKQALPRLRVADVWEAEPGRALREALALTTLHDLTPESVPDCLDVDESRYVLVMPHAAMNDSVSSIRWARSR